MFFFFPHYVSTQKMISLYLRFEKKSKQVRKKPLLFLTFSDRTDSANIASAIFFEGKGETRPELLDHRVDNLTNDNAIFKFNEK